MAEEKKLSKKEQKAREKAEQKRNKKDAKKKGEEFVDKDELESKEEYGYFITTFNFDVDDLHSRQP